MNRKRVLRRLKTIEARTNNPVIYTAEPTFCEDYSIKSWQVSAPDFDKTFPEDDFYKWSKGKIVDINFEDVSIEVLRGFVHSGN
ncbi:hypothetical protein [Streptococcus suis]|uniref:hypothetical protein n=1 Tax=Streptococcus suis TaxID=1307 RepID=UPI000462A809|nr:hypothetical protein [Streptococcus suis]RRR29707.1 hypothetical protein EI988_07850 [Streptococcus suis]RRR36814.1 hypothetical protein EI984_07855 [Streptococcus suis]RRR36865.1 hypothetical protein EI985_04395 [Streptococcus suis]RRR41046.1 hypothetical protein EI989_04985 [Streptococcus suis]RRR52036.1 hypothetical protein EI990_07545 [Streptococcus suis]